MASTTPPTHKTFLNLLTSFQLSPSPSSPFTLSFRLNSSNPRYPSLTLNLNPLTQPPNKPADPPAQLAHGSDGEVHAKNRYYNAQIVVGEKEAEESVVRRFRREVAKAGVIRECRRRRWFESQQEKRKRKARNAKQANRRSRPRPKFYPQDNHQDSKREEEEEDNWELPEGELPH